MHERKKPFRWPWLRLTRSGLLIGAAVALAPEGGTAMFKPGEPVRSFISVAEIGPLVAGSTARSCVYSLDDTGFLQVADEETNGVLHALRSGQGDTRSLLRGIPEKASPERLPLQPPTEYYPARIVLTAVAGKGEYRSDSFEAGSAPPEIGNFVRRVKSEVSSAPLQDAVPGLYGRARRQPDFDPEIESLLATFSNRQMASLPQLSALIAKEMSWVRLGSAGQPAALAQGISIDSGRALRIKVGEIVYLIQAYEFRIPEGKVRGSCSGVAPNSTRKG